MLNSVDLIRKIINDEYPANPEISDAIEEFSKLHEELRGRIPNRLFFSLEAAASHLSAVSFDYGVLYGFYLYKQILDIPSVAEHIFKNGTLYQDSDLERNL